MNNVVRASAAGSVALAAAQLIDIRVTGRDPSPAPIVAIERLLGRPVPHPAQTAVSYAAQSSVAAAAALPTNLIGGSFTRRLAIAYLAALSTGLIVDPALGASSWPSRWSASDWARELTLKGTLAIAVAATT